MPYQQTYSNQISTHNEPSSPTGRKGLYNTFQQERGSNLD